MSYSILIVDDHILFSEAIAELVKNMMPNCSVDCMTSATAALSQLNAKHYDYLFLDLVLPGETNYMTTNFISESRRNNPDLIIIMLSSVMELTRIKLCLKMGVNAFLSKAVNRNELQAAIVKTQDGQKFLSADLSKLFVDEALILENTSLTKKELEVLRLIAAGHSVRKAAELLYLSPYTILAHRRNIMSKLDLHTAPELVKYAYENKLN